MTQDSETSNQDDCPEFILSEKGDRAYTIQKKLGQGGNGEVYEVGVQGGQNFDEFKRPVEMAVMKIASKTPDKRQQQANIQALNKEIAIYKHASRGIIKMLDHGELLADGDVKLPYLILEKLHPHPFQKYNMCGEKAVDIATAIDTYVNLLDALDEMHKRKDMPLILCDIKPDNIMLRMSNSEGDIGDDEYIRRIAAGAYEPVLMDMGCAQDRDTLSRTNGMLKLLIGTPMYLPPEAIPRMKGKKLRPAFYFTTTDIYALTLSFYQYLTGERPYSNVRWLWQDKDPKNFLLNLIDCKQEKKCPIDKDKLYTLFQGQTAQDLEHILMRGIDNDPKERATARELVDMCTKRFKIDIRRKKEVKYFFDGVQGLKLTQQRFPKIKREKNSYTRRIQRATKRIKMKRKLKEEQ